MKYVGNHTNDFHHSTLAFIIGFIQCTQFFQFEVNNIIFIFTRPDIRLVVGSYVNVEIIYIVNSIYFSNAIAGDPSLAKLMELYNEDN